MCVPQFVCYAEVEERNGEQTITKDNKDKLWWNLDISARAAAVGEKSHLGTKGH